MGPHTVAHAVAHTLALAVMARDPGAEPRLDLLDLLQLLGGERGTQLGDRLFQLLGALGALDGPVGEALGEGEGLGIVAGRGHHAGAHRPLHGGLERVGEVAPGIELICADPDLRLHDGELLGETIGAVPAVHAVLAAALAHLLAAVLAGLGPGAPASVVAHGQGHRREAGDTQNGDDEDRGNSLGEFHLQHPQLVSVCSLTKVRSLPLLVSAYLNIASGKSFVSKRC